MTMRFYQLDSLRGLAALTVVFCHLLNVVPGVYGEAQEFWWLTRTPLALVRAGHASVVFFFVLSGFVLSLPFWKGAVLWRVFLVKRICRIWVPYVAATVLAIACGALLSHSALPGWSAWANHERNWPAPGQWLAHLSLIGRFDDGYYNPVVWSLVHEMRISLVFPLLVLLVGKGGWFRSTILAIGLSAGSLVLERICLWAHWNTDWTMTVHYASLFVWGMLLARHQRVLGTWYTKTSRPLRNTVFIAALCLFSQQSWLFPSAFWHGVPLVRDGLVALAVTVFVVFALSPSKTQVFLLRPPLVWLGRVSYSVYLYHAVIFLALLQQGWSLLVCATLTVALTGLLAQVAYRWVEVPSIRLGAWAAGRLGPVKAPQAVRKATCVQSV